MNEQTSSNSLTVVLPDDGFDSDGIEDRLIKGSIARCVDGKWSARDGSDLPSPLLGLSTTEACQLWADQKPAETIIKQAGQALPDVDALNAKIPKKKWETGLDGQPRPPWVKQHIVYLLNPRDASLFTYINSTAGARIAVRDLKDQVMMMRTLRGTHVVPLIELAAKPMKTQFGMKQRPFFKIIDWRNLSGETPAPQAIGAPVTPVSLKEEMADEVPWNDDLPSFDAG